MGSQTDSQPKAIKAKTKTVSQKPVPEWLQAAQELERQGKAPEAEKLYKQHLKENAEDDEALSGLAGIACRFRNYDAALVLANRAVKANPGNAVAITYMGVALLSGEHVKQAETCFKQAMKIEPDYPISYYHMASIRKEHYGDNEGAKALLHKALELNKNIPEALNLLGVICAEEGWVDEAIAYYKQALTYGSNVSIIQDNMGDIYMDRRDYEKAIECYKVAIEHEVVPELSMQYTLKLFPALYRAGMMDETYRYASQFLEREPENVRVMRVLLDYWIAVDDKDEAMKYIQKMYAINPDNVSIYSALVAIKKITPEDQEYITHMEALLEKVESEKEKKVLNFALGKAYNDLKCYNKAFVHFKKANKLVRKSGASLVGRLDVEKKWLLQHLTKEFFDERRDYGLRDNRPIFIVGMPRSGTTLTEQIISSHSTVFGGGEMPYIGKTLENRFVSKRVEADGELLQVVEFPEVLLDITSEQINECAQEYLTRVEQRFGEMGRFTDKMPTNALNLGVISLMFPDAKIVHCCRHPLDTCLSLYFHNFEEGIDYSYDMESMAQVYRLYVEYMEHWKRALNVPIFDICYEQLLDEPEKHVREMLKYCELDWESGCLEFYKNKRLVSTASHAEVKQPLYKTSKQRWKHYEKHLKPLIRELSDIIEDYEAKWMS